ncbi:protein serine/threonine phosphatase 2C, partial [Auricularia subglabra TFB-10046 SS5]
ANRRLAVSRALGDFEFKARLDLQHDKQIILACPEVGVYNLKGDEEFLVLATDGIWDTLSSQSVINYVRLQVSSGTPLADICEQIMEFCLAPEDSYRAGTDNMTCVIVALLAGRSLRGWYAWVRDHVEQRIGYHTPAVVQRPFDEFEVMRARDAWRAYQRQQAKAADKAEGDVWEVSSSRRRSDQDGRRKGGGKNN